MIEFNKEKFDNICENITILGESVVTAQLAYSKQVAMLDFFESTMFTDLIQQYSKAGEPYTETKLKYRIHTYLSKSFDDIIKSFVIILLINF